MEVDPRPCGMSFVCPTPLQIPRLFIYYTTTQVKNLLFHLLIRPSYAGTAETHI